MNKENKLEITCRFCPKIVVTLEFGPNQKLDFEALKAEFIDTRCSEHEIEFGNFKEMEKDYLEKVEDSHDNFMELMKKSEYKKSIFDKELEKLK